MVPSVRHAGAAQIGFDLREAGPIADAAVSHAGSGLCGAHRRSSALSGFLPVRPGSRAEDGAAIPGLDGQAAGWGPCTLESAGSRRFRSVAAGAWSKAAPAASSGRPWAAGTAAIEERAAG